MPLQYKIGTSIAADQSDKTVRLAVTLLPATGVRKGSVVMIAGGPGMPGIQPSLSPEQPVARLRESWDIVAYDARGVGRSTPTIRCKNGYQANADANDTQRDAYSMLEGCIKNTGVEVLKHMGTDEAVNDVDRIRQALQESKLTAVAYSYGTQVAALYAERFPTSVRAIVLDGVVDLDEAKNDYALQLNQSKSYQHTFERFTAWCAKTGRCPLSPDKTRATAQFQNLLSRLRASPVYSLQGRKVSDDELILLTTDLLLWRSDWPVLARAVSELDRGEVSKEITDRLEDYASTYGDMDALNVISCLDQSLPPLSQHEINVQKKRIREAFAATYSGSGENRLPDLCEIWPWRNHVHASRPATAPPLPPLLFVAQRYDPTTPWHNARAMASKFNSPLVTLEGDGHTLALSGINRCVDRAVVAYVLEPEKKRDETFCLPAEEVDGEEPFTPYSLPPAVDSAGQQEGQES